MTVLRMRFIPAFVAALISFNAQAETSRRDLRPFETVSFADAGEIEIAAGKTQSVALDSEEQDLSEIKTEVRDHTLYITRETHWWLFGFGDRENYRVRIELPHLAGLIVSGAARVRVKGLEGGDVAVTLTGATEMDAEGHVDSVALTMTGANKASFPNLILDTAVVTTVGAGEVLIKPAKVLTVTVIGAGHVSYEGAPHITKTMVGGGRLEKLD